MTGHDKESDYSQRKTWVFYQPLKNVATGKQYGKRQGWETYHSSLIFALCPFYSSATAKYVRHSGAASQRRLLSGVGDLSRKNVIDFSGVSISSARP